MRALDQRDLFSFEAVFVLFLFAGIVKAAFGLTTLPINFNTVALFLAAAVLGWLWVRGEWDLQFEFVLFLAVLASLLLYAAISVFWSESSNYAGYKLIRLFSVVPVACAGALVIGQSKQRFSRFCRCLVAAGIPLLGYLFYRFATGTLTTGLWIGNMSYLLPSRLLGAGALVCLYWLSGRRQNVEQGILFALVGLFTTGMLLSGSRGAFVALVGSVLTYLIVQVFRSNHRLHLPRAVRHLLFGGAAGVTSLGAAVYFSVINVSMFSVLNRMLRLVSPEQANSSLSKRIELYRAAIDHWLQSPVIGNGIGSFPIFDTGADIVYYPHNIILEIISELGLAGLSLFLVLGALSIARLYRFRHVIDRETLAFLASFGVFWFVAACFSFDITGNRYLFMALALMYATPRAVRSSGQDLGTTGPRCRTDTQQSFRAHEPMGDAHGG